MVVSKWQQIPQNATPIFACPFRLVFVKSKLTCKFKRVIYSNFKAEYWAEHLMTHFPTHFCCKNKFKSRNEDAVMFL